MVGLLNKLFKTKKEKDVKQLQPVVAAVNARYAELRTLSDDALRGETPRLQAYIQEQLAPLTAQIAELAEQARSQAAEGNIAAQEPLFEQIDRLKKERNQALEGVLEEIIPQAFAVMKETCRRLSQHGKLVVTATEWDVAYAATHPHVALEGGLGGTATWSNSWQVTGHAITWDMVHYDVQLMGGVMLHRGKIAEMATGEGKTLVSTLPAYLNALAGEGVHIVTVNDYLARRDAAWNGPVFEFHGLTVDVIDVHEPNTEARRQAYHAHITYGTNNEFGFDYLRDNMVSHADHLVQRAHHYAIVDEVDSVLIDEARTPLIISGPAPRGDRHEFNELKPRIERVYNLQRRLVNECLNQARTLLERAEKDGDKDAQKEGGKLLLRAHRGYAKFRPLIKYLSEPGIKTALQKTEAFYMQDNSKNMFEVDEELYFTIDEKNNSIELTDKGREALAQGDDPNLFVLPDLSQELYAIDQAANLGAEERLARKDAFVREYSEKTERLHSISQLLKAYTLFEKDVEYIVDGGKVMIVDENTGRIMHGRRYSDGLHQAIEAKENVRIEASTQTYATVTLQNYFRMYHKLAGMTGTAETEATELFQIYKLDVSVIPTNKPIVRDDAPDKVYKTLKVKYNAIIEDIIATTAKGRPVLVGTTSVESSELLSRLLRTRGIKHNVLNAKHHQREAEIVAEAGLPGNVTIATNMAGRGTDIKLGAGVREAGGLAIIGTERHDSRRIDRQLRGRAGRQGDPGSSVFYVSLEDDLMRLFGSERLARAMKFLRIKDDEVIQDKLFTQAITNAQKKVEENNFGIRKRLLEYDDVMNSQREAIYGRRRNALAGDRLQLDLDHMIYDLCSSLVQRYREDADAEALQIETLRTLSVDPAITQEELASQAEAPLTTKLYDQATAYYQRKSQRISSGVYQQIRHIRDLHPKVTHVEIAFTDGSARNIRLFSDIDLVLQSQGTYVVRELEKAIVLGVIDDLWKEHLRALDDLKQSVQTSVYEQKDPLLIYKFEAYELFQQMLGQVNGQTLSLLFRGEIAGHDERQRAPVVARDDFSRLQTSHGADGAPRGKRIAPPQPVGVDGQPQANQRPLSRRERREMERKKK